MILHSTWVVQHYYCLPLPPKIRKLVWFYNDNDIKHFHSGELSIYPVIPGRNKKNGKYILLKNKQAPPLSQC